MTNFLYDGSMNQHHLGKLVLWHHCSKFKQEQLAARLILIHGLGEHSERHLPTIEYLTSHLPLDVIRFDLRGAGRSGGKRQWIESFNDYVEDTLQALSYTQKLSPSLPIYLMGHSLGGAIATVFASQYQSNLSGLVLSAPAVQVGSSISSLTMMIGKMVSKIAPGYKLKSVGQQWLSRDPKVVEKYLNDPLSTHYTPLQQGKLILEMLAKMPGVAQQIEIPTIIFHGTHDRITDPIGSFQLLTYLKSKDKELCFLPQGYHEAHHDFNADYFFQRLELWIRHQLDNI